MKKRYNYFDDENIEKPVRKKAEHDHSRSKNNHSGTVHEAEEKLSRDIKKFAGKTKRVAVAIAKQSEEKFEEERKFEPKKLALQMCLFVAVVIILVAVISFMVSIGSENKREQEFDVNAGKICTKYVGEYGNCSYENLDTYGVSGYRLTGLCLVREVDFDDDGKSELLLGYNDNNKYFVEVWGFQGKKFGLMYKDTMYQTDDEKDDIWTTLYYHHGKYYIGKHDEKDVTKVTLYALKGNKFKKDGTCTYDTVSDTFFVGKKKNTEDFERIRMAVLRETAAYNTSDSVATAIDSFTSDEEKTATETSNKGNMKGAYYDIVRDLNQKFGVAKFEDKGDKAYIDGLAVVKLMDFDGDGTDELLTVYRRTVSQRKEDSNGNYVAGAVDKYFCSIYTWNGSTAFQVYYDEGLSNKLNNDTDVYFVTKQDGKKYYWCSNDFSVEEYGRVVSATSKILSFNGTAFEPEQKAFYQRRYGYTRYYFDDTQVSKESFTFKHGFAVPFFDGEETYDTDYSVTYLQTKSADSDKLKTIPSSTEAAIKELDSSYNPDNVVVDK